MWFILCWYCIPNMPTYISAAACVLWKKTNLKGLYRERKKMFENSFDTRVAVFCYARRQYNNMFNNISTFNALVYSVIFGRVLRTCRMYTHVGRIIYYIIVRWLCGTLLYDKKPVKKKKTFVGCKANGFGHNRNIIIRQVRLL